MIVLNEGGSTEMIDVHASVVGGLPQLGGTTASSSSDSSAATSSQQKKKPILFNSEDRQLVNLRDTNFAIAKTVSEIREFVGKLLTLQQEHQSLKLHTILAEGPMKQTRSDILNTILQVLRSKTFRNHFPIPHYQLNRSLRWNRSMEPTPYAIGIERPLRSSPITLPPYIKCLVGHRLKPQDLHNFKREVLPGYWNQHVLTAAAQRKTSATLIPDIDNIVHSLRSEGTSQPFQTVTS
ncbi:hypothetical protein HOY80DRAFT_1070060 [Tuber brumale]|nr:hypothetical protein HOY80DRAFT_1070060 [Tuber brumale]